MRKLPQKEVRLFQDTIYDYFKANKREFPWRYEKNPYFILVSEVMLQQTQVARSIEKYQEFITIFPTLRDLAESPLSRVLKTWQGLGYNRRGKFLHETAHILQEEYNGIIPHDPKVLSTFPGIGPATAGAIITYAYDEPSLFIETNIRAVYLHFFFKDTVDIPDSQLLPLVEQTLDAEHPRDWFYALTDYGVMLKKEHKFQNTQSRHYQRQSPFEGSNRQVRGAIMKHITTYNEPLSRETLYKDLGFKKERIDQAIDSLLADAMLVKDADGTYKIQDSEK